MQQKCLAMTRYLVCPGRLAGVDTHTVRHLQRNSESNCHASPYPLAPWQITVPALLMPGRLATIQSSQHAAWAKASPAVAPLTREHACSQHKTAAMVQHLASLAMLRSPAVAPLTCEHACSQDKMAAMVQHLASLAILRSPAVVPLTREHACSQDKMAAMVKHLASLAEGRLILSFAPSTPALLLLKRIGEFFPKGSKVSPARTAQESCFVCPPS